MVFVGNVYSPLFLLVYIFSSISVFNSFSATIYVFFSRDWRRRSRRTVRTHNAYPREKHGGKEQKTNETRPTDRPTDRRTNERTVTTATITVVVVAVVVVVVVVFVVVVVVSWPATGFNDLQGRRRPDRYQHTRTQTYVIREAIIVCIIVY